MIARALIALTLFATLGACGDSPTTETSPSAAATTMPAPPSTTPSATPSTPSFPPAKDGQNYKSCTDGNCEVLLHKAASLTIDGKKVKATVVDGTVKLTLTDGYVSLSGGGMTTWGESNGPLHTITLKAAKGDTAIMRLVTH